MTVGAGSVVRGPFLPDGLITDWPFPFTARQDSEVVPRLVTPTGSFVPPHTVARNNAVHGAGEGGRVIITPPLAPGAGELWISYLPAMDQEVAFEDQARFSPTVMNGALDLAASRDQYLDARLDRAQKVRLGETGPGIPPLAVRAGSIRAWTPDGADERTDIKVSAWFGAVSAIALLQAAVKVLQTQVTTLFGMISRMGGGSGGGGALSGLDLSNYISSAQQISDVAKDRSQWQDVSEQLRQAFADAAAFGVSVDATRMRGNYFIDPATPILVRSGSGFTGPKTAYPTLSYAIVDDTLQDKLISSGLNFIIDPQSANRKVPKFALQGSTTVEGLSVVGVGLAGEAETMIDLSKYPVDPDNPENPPVITGWEEFATDAPVICTDHRHNPDGTPTAQELDANGAPIPGVYTAAKAGGIRLECSLIGMMQGVCIGDPLLKEEPWATFTSSGKVSGSGGNSIEIEAGPMLRVLTTVRKTSTSMDVKIRVSQPSWNGLTQPLSGRRSNFAWLKVIQEYGRGIDMWHRAVGFNIDMVLRGFRYGVHCQAGYSPDGPVYAPPAPGVQVAVGDVVSGADTNVFVAYAPGPFATLPQASGPNYDPATQVFSDPASAVQWRFTCEQQDTGKYNNGSIKIGGERIITPIYLHHNAYMHNADITIKGHLMNPWNMKGENAPVVSIQSHKLIAGAIDKAVYDAWKSGYAYAIDDKITDGAGSVWSCTQAGTSTTPPMLVFADPGSVLQWQYIPTDKAVYSGWVAQTYAVGQKITHDDGRVWQCSQAGQSTVAPAFAGTEQVFQDGGTRVFADPASPARWTFLPSDTGTYPAWQSGRCAENQKVTSDGGAWICTQAGDSTAAPTYAAADWVGGLQWHFRNFGWKPFGEDPFARISITGLVQEASGPFLQVNAFDGHGLIKITDMPMANWSQSQGRHQEALIQNASPTTNIKHLSSEAFASGNANRVYDVTYPQTLRVGDNDYYGYKNGGDGSLLPNAIGGVDADDNPLLGAEFFSGTNCEAHDYYVADGDDDDATEGAD